MDEIKIKEKAAYIYNEMEKLDDYEESIKTNPMTLDMLWIIIKDFVREIK
jgi:hypothetical protein